MKKIFALTSLRFCLLMLLTTFLSTNLFSSFIVRQSDLVQWNDRGDFVCIASPGRSGSTFLFNVCVAQLSGYQILKTHILPPTISFSGKFIFIFSNPNQAAESALYILLRDSNFGRDHFRHLESSDQNWLNDLGSTANQTEIHNLLNYDALGCCQQLEHWLYTDTIPCGLEEANVLAIKYENLWDDDTVQALKDFLSNDKLVLPAKAMRGYTEDSLSSRERLFRTLYNQGSFNEPRYEAYDKARDLWLAAPPFQYYRVIGQSL